MIVFARLFRLICVIGLCSIGLCAAGVSRADTLSPKDAACQAPTGASVKKALEHLGDLPQLTAYPGSPVAPAGADYTVVLARDDASSDGAADKGKTEKGGAVAFYRVLMDAEGLPKLIDGFEISAHPVSESSPQRKAKTVPQGAIELVIPLRALEGYFFHRANFAIIGCTGQGAALFVSRFQSRVSDGPTFYLLCIVIVALVYWGIGKWCKSVDDGVKTKNYKIGWASYLDPVVISSGPNGKGSISRLQVLVFSVIVFYITLYSFLRLGALPEMSTTVLLLLGISAFGAAASKVTDNSKNRLDWDCWAWLINIGWLPENGLAAITKAKWADLITAADGVDVYHFQMLVFSLVVAVGLLMTGIYGLATFDIPESLLALLGLSQAVYVGGKIVAQPSCSDLNAGIRKLWDLQKDYRKVADPKKPTKQADVADLPDYGLLQDQYEKVVTMFQSVIGRRFAATDTNAFELEAKLSR